MLKVRLICSGGRRKLILALLVVSTFITSGCNMPNDFWVNVASSGSLTATNGFVSAFVGSITQDLFATTDSGGGGDAGSGDLGAGEEADHDDGDEH